MEWCAGAEPAEILARADAAGATHAFAAALRERKIGFSLGSYVTESVGQAALALPDGAWQRALNADGDERDGAWVAELTEQVELSGWPEHTRLIVRRERPHPGAQLRFTDVDGHRYQAFLTDQAGDDLAALESVIGCTRALRTASLKAASSASDGWRSAPLTTTKPGWN